MPITKVPERPKSRVWEIQIDGRKFEDEDQLFARITPMVRGQAYYMKTQFADQTVRRISHNRQKNFKGGYFMYTFWFKSEKDAAIVKLMFR